MMQVFDLSNYFVMFSSTCHLLKDLKFFFSPQQVEVLEWREAADGWFLRCEAWIGWLAPQAAILPDVRLPHHEGGVQPNCGAQHRKRVVVFGCRDLRIEPAKSDESSSEQVT